METCDESLKTKRGIVNGLALVSLFLGVLLVARFVIFL